MTKYTITETDKQVLLEKGISEDVLMEQLKSFEDGFPFLELSAAASVDKGIKIISSADEKYYLDVWDNYCTTEKRIVKFVPASGAASRMFKDLYGFIDASYDIPTTNFEKSFFDNLDKFAFYKELEAICLKNEKKGVHELLELKRYKDIVKNLLLENGLNYGNLPKGLLKFHNYEDCSRTPVEEHLKEGYLYAKNNNGIIDIHFTVSPEHRLLFENLIKDKIPALEKSLGVKYNISFSEQKSSTDTVAVDSDNKPFTENGRMVFRPAGHGALIENLNELDADVVFIKNIDNVIPDKYKAIETRYKKILAGVLVDTQDKIFEYLRIIDSGKYTHERLMEILHFLQKVLNVKNPDTKFLEDAELVLYLKRKLDRPCRVCGMVKNVGEPGGGPFLAYNQDGTISPQILESSQIDMNNLFKKNLFDNGTHFNPVDLVCGIKDYRGFKFDLKNFVDTNTGFISKKSKNGKEIKALELPGLWNGAMSDWNTIFVEVPVDVFNPVKTVNDLLREHHL